MSRTLFFLLLTAAAASGVAIDRIAAIADAPACKKVEDVTLQRFLAPPPFPVDGQKRY